MMGILNSLSDKIASWQYGSSLYSGPLSQNKQPILDLVAQIGTARLTTSYVNRELAGIPNQNTRNIPGSSIWDLVNGYSVNHTARTLEELDPQVEIREKNGRKNMKFIARSRGKDWFNLYIRISQL